MADHKLLQAEGLLFSGLRIIAHFFLQEEVYGVILLILILLVPGSIVVTVKSDIYGPASSWTLASYIGHDASILHTQLTELLIKILEHLMISGLVQ